MSRRISSSSNPEQTVQVETSASEAAVTAGAKLAAAPDAERASAPALKRRRTLDSDEALRDLLAHMKRPMIVGISGCTCAGKGLLSQGLVRAMAGAHQITYLSQDDFTSLERASLQASGWESTASIDHARFRKAVSDAIILDPSPGTRRVVIVEGFRAFHDKELLSMLDHVLWLKLSRETCWARRVRSDGVSREVFCNHIWPRHEEYGKECSAALAGRGGVTVLDGEQEPDSVLRAALAAIGAAPSASHHAVAQPRACEDLEAVAQVALSAFARGGRGGGAAQPPVAE